MGEEVGTCLAQRRRRLREGGSEWAGDAGGAGGGVGAEKEELEGLGEGAGAADGLLGKTGVRL
jgi:hypothetical protein